MFKRIMPKEVRFFDFFEQLGALAIEAGAELHAISMNPSELARRANLIGEIEHKADAVTQACIDALHRTFITPIDRGDIHRLITRLDDVIDCVDSAVTRMALYELADSRPELQQFSEVLVRATTDIEAAVRGLRNLNREGDAIHKRCEAIYGAENEADQILRAALVRLFKEEKDTIYIIKWKEIFERLERATDRCEQVGNIIQGVVIEAS